MPYLRRATPGKQRQQGKKWYCYEGSRPLETIPPSSPEIETEYGVWLYEVFADKVICV